MMGCRRDSAQERQHGFEEPAGERRSSARLLVWGSLGLSGAGGRVAEVLGQGCTVPSSSPPSRAQSAKGVIECLKIITRAKSQRIAKFAFDFATKKGRSKVTAVHKANIM